MTIGYPEMTVSPFKPGDALVCIDCGDTPLSAEAVYHVAKPLPDLPTKLVRLREYPSRLFHPRRFVKAPQP